MSGIVADNIDRQSGVIAEPAGGPEVRSDDPSASAGVVWFNTTSGVLKVYRNVGAWSSGGNLNTGRAGLSGSNGTQSACFIAGGDTSGGRTLNSETYNGSSWTSRGDLTGSGRSNVGHFGTSTAGAVAGGWTGSIQTLTNEFNGASWTDVSAALGTGSFSHGACGTQTAALSRVGGYDDVSIYRTCEEYDGTSHSASADLAGDTYAANTCGTSSSAIRAGGHVGGVVATCETFNGTSWSSSSALAQARRQSGTFGASNSDATVTAGWSGSADLDSTESWNGSSWASGDTLAAARRQSSGSGSSSGTGLVAGGTSNTNTTEEFSDAVTARTVTDS